MDGLEQDKELVRGLVDFAGTDVAAVARKARIAPSTLQRPHKGSATTRLSQRTIEKLQAAYPHFPGWNRAGDNVLPFRSPPDGQVDMAELTRIVGEMVKAHLDDPARALASANAILAGEDHSGDAARGAADMVIVRRYRALASAGAGLEPLSEESEEGLAFSRGFLRGLGISADKAALLEVRGESMAPTIQDRSMVLLQKTEEAAGEGVYVFSRDGQVAVKRLHPVRQEGYLQSLVVTADNPAYPPETLSGASMNALRVIGRVRYVLTPI